LAAASRLFTADPIPSVDQLSVEEPDPFPVSDAFANANADSLAKPNYVADDYADSDAESNANVVADAHTNDKRECHANRIADP
jgi:hypothetical protein